MRLETDSGGREGRILGPIEPDFTTPQRTIVLLEQVPMH